MAPNHPVKLKYHSKQTPSFWCHEIWHHRVPNERKQHIKQKTGLGGGFNPFELNIRQNDFIFPKLEVKNSKHMFESNHPPKTGPLAIIPLISPLNHMDLKSCNVQGHWDVDPFIAARIMLKLTTSQATTVSAKAQSLDRLEASPHTPFWREPRWNMEYVVNRNWLMDNNNTICKSYIYICKCIYLQIHNHPDYEFGKQNWPQNSWQIRCKWIPAKLHILNKSTYFLHEHATTPWSISQYPPIFRLSTPLKYFLRFLGTTNWHKTYISAGVGSLGRLRNKCIYIYILIHAKK